MPTLRQMGMLTRSLPAAVVLVALLGAAGCGGSSSPSSLPADATDAEPDRQQAVPAEFAAACGKPGARVGAPTRIPIGHADCDLTGVTISSPGQGGAVVPGQAVSNSGGLSLSTNPDGDVTVSREQ